MQGPVHTDSGASSSIGTWDAYLSPTRCATLDLLCRLASTLARADRTHPGCILVTGESGSGKTTVLKAASELCLSHPSALETQRPRTETERESAMRRYLLNDGLRILRKHLHWIDVLDVEPMPSNANFLTTLLIAIRRSLFPQPTRTSAPMGLLAELEGNPKAELDRLITESAFVWQEIHESDTRDRAHRQQRAAEHYTSFRQDLSRALEMLGKALDEQRSGSSRWRTKFGCTLVLPIDNVDRSAEHAEAVFKVAQLVASPHLILVLSGDRSDIADLLARSYGRSLARSQDAHVPARFDDEEGVIARRQAASVLSKVCPPHLRVTVDSVYVQEALNFALDDQSSLSDLLERIALAPRRLPAATQAAEGRTHEAQGGGAVWREPRNLCELLAKKKGRALSPGSDAAAQQRASDGASQRELFLWEPTELAQYALQLTARQLISLWLFAASQQPDREPPSLRIAPCFDESQSNHVQTWPLSTYYVPRIMVRLLTAESALPHWAAELIQDRIVQRTPEARTELVLADAGQAHVNVQRTYSNLASYHGSIIRNGELLLVGEVLLPQHHDFRVRVRQGDRSALLPARLGAWLLVLHDLLKYSPEPLVVNPPRDLLKGAGPSVITRWRGRCGRAECSADLSWPRPAWGTLYQHTLMNSRWNELLNEVIEAGIASDEQTALATVGDDAMNQRVRSLLALAWIHVILELGQASLEGRRFTKGQADALTKCALKPEPLRFRRLEACAGGQDSESKAQRNANFEKFRDEVIDWAERTFTCMRNVVLSMPRTAADLADRALYDWLERDFPRFFTGELDTGLTTEDLPVSWTSSDRVRTEVALRRHGALVAATTGQSASEPAERDRRMTRGADGRSSAQRALIDAVKQKFPDLSRRGDTPAVSAQQPGMPVPGF